MTFTTCWRSVARTALALCLVSGLLACSATNDDPLAQWKRARQNQDAAPATWVAIGDSITEGQGASARQNRWIDQTAAALAPGATADYLPAWYAVYGPDSLWESYAERSGTVRDESFGSLGLRTATMETGASQTYELTGTSADLYYLTGGGLLAYSVDDGPATTIDTAGVYSTANRRRVDFPTPGAHRLTVTALTGTGYLSGVTEFDGDEDNGLHVFDNAHSGYTCAQFVAAEEELGPIMAMVQPDLVTIELGVNDYLQGSATPAELEANLRDMVVKLRQRLEDQEPSIVLVLPYGIDGDSPGADPSWEDYAAAIRSLGAELSVGVLDMSSMGVATEGGYWSTDGLHPSDAGNAEMARLATAYLAAG